MGNRRLDHLEFALMELSTEMFQLRHQVLDLTECKERLHLQIHELQDLLDEKGVITKEEFERHLDVTDPDSLPEDFDSCSDPIKKEFH